MCKNSSRGAGEMKEKYADSEFDFEVDDLEETEDLIKKRKSLLILKRQLTRIRIELIVHYVQL